MMTSYQVNERSKKARKEWRRKIKAERRQQESVDVEKVKRNQASYQFLPITFPTPGALSRSHDLIRVPVSVNQNLS